MLTTLFRLRFSFITRGTGGGGQARRASDGGALPHWTEKYGPANCFSWLGSGGASDGKNVASKTSKNTAVKKNVRGTTLI